MEQIRIYVDEDAARRRLVDALRSRGVTVITALEMGLTGKPDSEQLVFAADGGYVLYSHNASDFFRLHSDGSRAGASMQG